MGTIRSRRRTHSTEADNRAAVEKENPLARPSSFEVELLYPHTILAIGQLRRSMPVGVGWHEGVLVETSGGNVVYDRTFKHGLRRGSLESFSEGRRCRVAYRTSDPQQIFAIVSRLRAAVVDPTEQKYNLIFRNCEQLATKVLTGKRVSVQVAVVGTAALIATAALLGRFGRSKDEGGAEGAEGGSSTT